MKKLRFYLGKGFQLLGLFITFEAIVFYFGSSETGKLMGMGFGGAFVFFLGWLLIKDLN